MEDKIIVKDLHPHALTNQLIRSHCIGTFRDEADIDNSKYHVSVTLQLVKELLEKCEWTKEELLEAVNSNLEGVEMFHGK